MKKKIKPGLNKNNLNKLRQVKGVDSNTSTGIYSIDNQLIAMPNITALMVHFVKKYPNDADLGKHVRNTIMSWKEE
tara:strand:- start:3453 stop:3680 length:228 start_codon:yes stop_codon:yes gene_type:complete